jgi:hypothetical protein
MATIEHQITEIYSFLDDALKADPNWSAWRQSNNAAPEFTDAEVLTVALMQGCLGVATLKKTYALIAENHGAGFPRLPSYKQWIARLHLLSDVVRHLVSVAFGALGLVRLSIFDSKPLPLCARVRHGVVRLMREDGAWWGKSSKGWFFGFKLHAVIDADGRILHAMLLPGNVDDREAARVLASAVDGGIGLGDLGYGGRAFQDELADEVELLMLTRRDKPEKRMLLGGLRARVEVAFAELWAKFLDRIYSRSWLGLWNTVKLKLLHHNLVASGLLTP